MARVIECLFGHHHFVTSEIPDLTCCDICQKTASFKGKMFEIICTSPMTVVDSMNSSFHPRRIWTYDRNQWIFRGTEDKWTK